MLVIKGDLGWEEKGNVKHLGEPTHGLNPWDKETREEAGSNRFELLGHSSHTAPEFSVLIEGGKAEVSKNKMPPLNHLPRSGVRAVIGNALIIKKVTAFQNLQAFLSFVLVLPFLHDWSYSVTKNCLQRSSCLLWRLLLFCQRPSGRRLKKLHFTTAPLVYLR